MKINPIRMYYVTSTNETTILYEITAYPSKKAIEKIFVFKGKFEQPPTIFNITTFLERELKNKPLNT